MSVMEIEEMGPIDYIVLEWPGRQPTGEVAPMIVDLADRGIIRVLDIAFMVKREDGTVDAIEIGDLDGDGFDEFEGASSGLIGQDDLEEAAAALRPGTSAAVLVWENRWAAPVAVALRRSGGELVASGRLPVQAVVAALEAAEARTLNRRGATACQDYSAGSPAPPSSPAPPRPSATASRAARRSAGPPRSAQLRRAAATHAPPPPPPPPAEDPIAKLKELAALRDQGILTDQEFADQKAKLLA